MANPRFGQGASPQGSSFTRRNVLQMLGLAAAAPLVPSLLAGCAGSGGGGAEGNPDSGELNFVYMGDNAQQEAFTQLFDLFQQSHPNITLNATGIASDGDWSTYCNTVATRLAGGTKIDIIQVATEGQRLFASKGVLADLTPYMEQDKDVVDDYWADVNPKLKEFNEQFGSGPNGEPVFIPGGFNTMCMYLNKPVFEAAGVPIPEKDWTWDEFLQAARTIKQKTGAFMTSTANSYFVDVMPLLTTNGTSTFDADWTEATFDTPEAIEAAEFARQLVVESLVPEPGGQFEADEQFKQGKLAILRGGRWPTIGVRSVGMIEQTRVVNYPTKVGNGSPVGWDAWNITKNSNNKQAAWTFIKFLMSKEAGEYFASIGGTIVPARNSVAASPAFTDNAPEGSLVLSEALSFATPIPSIDRGAEAQKAIQDAWMAVISGNQPAADALRAAQSELESLL